jgi:hypothetical protein
MDLSPKSLSRALPWLAGALAAEGIIALALTFKDFQLYFDTCMQVLIHVPQFTLLLGFAGAVIWMTSGGASRIPCQRLLYGAAASIASTALARFVDVDVSTDSPRGWLFLQALVAILTALALPGLWGCALAREEDLSSTRITAPARISAGGTFASVVLLVASEISAVAALGVVEIVKRATVIGALSSLVLTVGRGCLLWGAWETWRPAADEIVLHDRAKRVSLLMLCSLMGFFWSAVISAFNWHAESHGFGTNWYFNVPILICQGLAQLTMSLIATILLAVALEAPERLSETKPQAPDFQPPPEPPRDTSPIDVP